MKKFLLSTALLLTTAMGAWADVLPTEKLQASRNLPTGTPEHQYYIRQTKGDGQYWTATSTNTNDKNSAGKFAFYAVPGLTNCYYIYNVGENKWLSYSGARDDMKSFASFADNFNAYAYWEITASTLKGTTTPCYQLRPTTGNRNPAIKTDKYANWFQNADRSSTIGLWQQGPTQDAGSAWSLEAVEADNTIKMAQEIALANRILDARGYAYTKGDDILTTDNVTTIISSPYTETTQGSIAGIVDGGNGFWHSAWQGGDVDNGSHYIVANIGDDTPELMSFSYEKRSDAKADFTTRWAVYGVPSEGTVTDGSRDGLTLLAVVSTPNTISKFDNLPPFETKGFKKFRFYSEVTTNNRGYFHIGEFQLNGMIEADSNADNLKALAAAVKTAEGKTNPTEEDINALKDLNAAFNATAEEKAAAQALLDLTGVGYPSATAEARVALAAAVAGNVPSIELQELVAAYKACTDIALPEDGKAYTFKFMAIDGNEYNLTASGTTLGASATDAASVFYCRKYTNVEGNERYAFITADGKFLRYHALTDKYTIHKSDAVGTKRLLNDFVVASMVGGPADQITASLKEKLFGTVYILTNDRADDNDSDGAFILNVNGTTLSFDNSSVPFFNNSRNNLTSAIKVTEVTDYTAADDVLVAASTITPLVESYKHPFGSGLNQYVATFKSAEYADFNSLETAIKAETSVIADGAVAFAINMPNGKAFKVKTNQTSARFLSLKDVEAGNNAKIVSGEENADIFLLTSDGKMVSYTAGLGLTDAEKVAAPGATINTMTFSNGTNIGCYAIDTDRDNEWSYLYWNDGENLLSWNVKIGNTDWTLTEVTALPIKMNAVGGVYYATFNAPVSVVIPEGLKAYSATIAESGDVLNLTKVAENGAVLAANTPVILYSEADVTALTISAEEGNAAASNGLSGTNQKITVTANGNYVLGNKGGIGFYKYNNTTMPAFKAYLTLNSEAPAFSFSFGDVETAINAIESDNSKAVIYDIAGRRVQKAAKGLYIVNGKKVMFK